MGAEAALGAAPEVVRQPDRRDRRHRGVPAQRDRPPNERQASPAEVERERAGREDRVKELPAAVREALCVAPRRPVTQRQVALLDREAGPDRVDRHPHLAAEPGREREARCAGAWRERTLARERLPRLEPAAEANESPPGPLREPEPSALALGERRDRDVGTRVEQRPQLAGQVCVAHDEPAGDGRAFAGRERLSLPAARQSQDDCSRRLGLRGRAVARAVVGDEHLSLRKRLPQRADRPPDPALLVAGGDEDGQSLIHPSSRPVAARPAAGSPCSPIA